MEKMNQTQTVDKKVQLKKIQEINFKLLKEMKRVCQENNIHFFLDSGTLIGCVREKDFIEWDDDADVVMLREEYEKLKELPKEVWGEEFRFLTYEEYDDGYFFDCLSHLFYIAEKNENGKRMLEKIQDVCDEELLDCISIDIFVLDRTHDSAILHKFKFLHWYLCYGLLLGHRPSLDYNEYNGIVKIYIYFISHIGKRISLDKLFKRYKRMCTSVKKSSHMFYSNITLMVATKKHLKREWWTDGTIQGELHGEFFPIPARYHDILTYEYGDYMTPPKKENRVPIHFIENKRENNEN